MRPPVQLTNEVFEENTDPGEEKTRHRNPYLLPPATNPPTPLPPPPSALGLFNQGKRLTTSCRVQNQSSEGTWWLLVHLVSKNNFRGYHIYTKCNQSFLFFFSFFSISSYRKFREKKLIRKINRICTSKTNKNQNFPNFFGP